MWFSTHWLLLLAIVIGALGIVAAWRFAPERKPERKPGRHSPVAMALARHHAIEEDIKRRDGPVHVLRPDDPRGQRKNSSDEEECE